MEVFKNTRLINNPLYGDFALISGDPPREAKVNKVGHHVNLTFPIEFKMDIYDNLTFQHGSPKKIILEYSSPNTNKPQHIGHLRNALLGESTKRLLKEAGHSVIAINLLNDRGTHICKSMLMYKLFNDTTVASLKGDKLVGHYYVMFNSKLTAEYEKGAQEMLQKWEAGDSETVELWNKLTNHAIEGFYATYKLYNISFDVWERESELYTKAKDIIRDRTDIFTTSDDGSVFASREAIGLGPSECDKVTVLRSDGTSIYMTQDIGVAAERIKKYSPDKMVYVVADEQNAHFKTLFALMSKLGHATDMYHLSYGMINLTTGRLKSREGHVVDADDLYHDLVLIVKTEHIEEWKDLTDEDVEDRASKIALAAIKYQFLSVKPQKKITFDPHQSIQLQGKTGPYILYTYARLGSIFKETHDIMPSTNTNLLSSEFDNAVVNDLLNSKLELYSAFTENEPPPPSLVCELVYRLCKSTNQLYNNKDHKIKGSQGTDLPLAAQRLGLLNRVRNRIGELSYLLNIELVEAV